MTDVVREALAAEIAEIPQTLSLVIFTDSTGYGVDMWCWTDVAADMHLASGVEMVAYDVARRYLTARGTLEEDPDYGLALVDWLHGAVEGKPATWEILVEQEALKDPRVTAATCKWVARHDVHEVSIELEIPGTAGVEVQRLVFTVGAGRLDLLT